MNICIFLHSNIKKFIKSTYKNLDKRPLSLRSSQASDFSSRIFRAQIYQAFVTPHNWCEFSEHFCDLSYRSLVSNRNPRSIHNRSSEATLKPLLLHTTGVSFQSTSMIYLIDLWFQTGTRAQFITNLQKQPSSLRNSVQQS